MSLRRAALLATIPWTLVIAAFFITSMWGDMVATYGWHAGERRMGAIAVILYVAFIWALTVSRPARSKP